MPKLAPLLAFAAHPDDLEFAAGAVVAKEVRAGRACHFVICSRGESASSGTPAQRVREAKAGAKILGATVEFITLGGDGHLKARSEYTVKVAGIIRKHRSSIVLAPTSLRNQHPDHGALGLLTQNAARLARYGGLKELKKLPPYAIDALLFYAVTPEAEPNDVQPVLIDVSDGAIIEQWTRAMSAHASQLKTRNYVELQLTRARLWGLRAGVEFAVPLFPNDPLVFESLAPIARTARRF